METYRVPSAPHGVLGLGHADDVPRIGDVDELDVHVLACRYQLTFLQGRTIQETCILTSNMVSWCAYYHWRIQGRQLIEKTKVSKGNVTMLILYTTVANKKLFAIWYQNCLSTSTSQYYQAVSHFNETIAPARDDELLDNGMKMLI